MSMESNILQFPQEPRAIVRDRTHIREIEPRIDKRLDERLKEYAEAGKTVLQYTGFLVETESYKDFLRPYWGMQGINEKAASRDTIFMYLPDEFEPIISELVMQQPGPFAYPDVDLMMGNVYFGWYCEHDDSSLPRGLWVYDGILHEAINDYFKRDEVRRDWVPVIMVSGDSVAIGGFAVDDDIAFGAQAASMSLQSLMPEEIYSDDELRAASLLAKEVGLAPWFDGPYDCSPFHGLVVAVSILIDSVPGDKVPVSCIDMDDDSAF